MATIRQTVTLQDKMSSTLSKIERQALSNLKTYKQLEKQQDNVKKSLDDLTRAGQGDTDMANQLRMTYETLGDHLIELRDGFGNVIDEEEDFINTNNNAASSMTEVNQALEVSKKAWNMLSGAIREASEWVDTYNNQFTAEFTAGTSMSAMMGMSSEDIGQIYDYAKALQEVGVIGDEALISGAGIMASAATSKEGLEQLMEAAANATVANEGLNASQASYESTANQLRRALEGSASMLVRNNILTKEQADYIDDINDKEKKQAELIRLVNGNTQEANKLLAQTAQGGMMQANNALGDMQEQLGEAVLPYFAAFQQVLVDILQPIIDFAEANSNWLIPTIITLTAGIGVLTAALIIFKLQALLPAIAAAWAFVAPFIPIIALIVAFVAAINIAAQALSEWSGTAVSALGLVFGALNVMLTALQNVFIDLFNACQFVINGISELFISLGQLVIGIVNEIASAIDYVFGTNLSENTQHLLNELNSAKEAIENDPGFIERKSYSESYQKGYDYGANLFGEGNKLFDKMGKTEDLFNKLDTDFNKVVTPAGGGGKAIKTTSDDKLLTDEDIKLLLDVATRDYQLNYQQMTPNITVTMGDIRETADVNEIMDTLGDRIQEILDGDAEVPANG